MGRGPGGVKHTGRDDPVGDVIHICIYFSLLFFLLLEMGHTLRGEKNIKDNKKNMAFLLV
jgi:hypothetical protein